MGGELSISKSPHHLAINNTASVDINSGSFKSKYILSVMKLLIEQATSTVRDCAGVSIGQYEAEQLSHKSDSEPVGQIHCA
jgi:hypothetical protein